ncbi:meteorin-like protein isoform X1 [Tachysurus fulvidraco]|uniref:meteorin-like protein isoform X1 n=1 Tax=Tachysurus fulvidraco TaxID=1234273 RepID=UPI000F501CA2|nr:meteorin-like protein isoform X1 [Tachysurus fulvidraco]
MSPRGIRLLQYLHTLCILTSCTADVCNWRGSGLVDSPLSGSVQQVRLRCAAGSVTWFSPRFALRVVLQPNVWSSRHAAVCVKALRGFHGAAVYVERAAGLDLLLQDEESPEQVRCFRAHKAQSVAIFLQANPQGHAGPSIVGFRYELLREDSSSTEDQTSKIKAACRPCNDSEILKAICSSDFVVHGLIRNVTHDLERQTSVVEVQKGRVYRQRSGVFGREPNHSGSWHGYIHTLLKCGVKAGAGQFLFTGAELFGEAWLGCAPRFKDFQILYHSAKRAHLMPCDFSLD